MILINTVGKILASSGPVVHIAPGTVFNIGSLSITNSMLYGWLSIIFICIFLIKIAKKITVNPQGGAVQFVEAIAEFIINLVENNFDDKKKARKYVPYFVTLFFFILLNNWLGLLPIVGEGFQSFGLPLFRPFTADLDATLAMGVFTMIYVYVSSVKESGGLIKYFKHFFVGNPLNPLYFTIGLLEILTDLTRVFSLSLRLFLNIAIGEIVIAVFSYLGHALAPLTALPFTLIELFVTALQAYIFTILSVMYLAIVVNHASQEELDEGVE